MKAKLTLHEKSSSELFIAAKRAWSELVKLTSSLQKVADKIGYQRYTIVRDPVMGGILHNNAGFSEVVGIFGGYSVCIYPNSKVSLYIIRIQMIIMICIRLP